LQVKELHMSGNSLAVTVPLKAMFLKQWAMGMCLYMSVFYVSHQVVG